MAEVGGVRRRAAQPGPGTPEDAGVCVDAGPRAAPASVPIFGVCLGLQAMAVAYGGDGRPGAGAAARQDRRWSHHEGVGVLAGLPDPFTATRYHSLAVDAGDRAGRLGGHRADRRPA